MTVLVTRFRIKDVAKIERAFRRRAAMRAQHGCTRARLLTNALDPESVLMLFDFPSTKDAQAYLNATMYEAAGEEILPELREREIFFYEEVAHADEPVSRAS